MRPALLTKSLGLLSFLILVGCASPSEFVDSDDLKLEEGQARLIKAQLAHAPENTVRLRISMKWMNGKEYSSSLSEEAGGWRSEKFEELKSILTSDDLFDQEAEKQVVFNIRMARAFVTGKTGFSVSAKGMLRFAIEDAEGNTLFLQNCDNEATAEFVSDALTWDGLYNAAQMKAVTEGFLCFREALIENSDEINRQIQSL